MKGVHSKNSGGSAATSVVVVVIALLLAGCTAPRLDPAPHRPIPSSGRMDPAGGVDARTVREAFKTRGMADHLEALQRVADANSGNRAAGTSGYKESARYVEEQLRAAGYSPVRQTFTYRGDRRGKRVETFNIIADTEGSPDHTVVVGGHLDSVSDGPGINDNGSGVAAILETALWMAETGIKPANRVRFAFWGGEEDGLYGSQHYVDALSTSESRQTSLNLNVDMVASPNGVLSVHDGDGSDFGNGGPAGSQDIEAVFFRYFGESSLPAETTPFDGGSDYAAFLKAGIPAGGLFTGDVETKTAAQARDYGGVAGRDLDSCYHRSCDTTENINQELLESMSGALAYTTVAFAMGQQR